MIVSTKVLKGCQGVQMNVIDYDIIIFVSYHITTFDIYQLKGPNQPSSETGTGYHTKTVIL